MKGLQAGLMQSKEQEEQDTLFLEPSNIRACACAQALPRPSARRSSSVARLADRGNDHYPTSIQSGGKTTAHHHHHQNLGV